MYNILVHCSYQECGVVRWAQGLVSRMEDVLACACVLRLVGNPWKCGSFAKTASVQQRSVQHDVDGVGQHAGRPQTLAEGDLRRRGGGTVR